MKSKKKPGKSLNTRLAQFVQQETDARDDLIHPQTPPSGGVGAFKFDVRYDLTHPQTPPPGGVGAFKLDSGKVRLSLLPKSLLWDVARVREYGCAKYGDPEGWKKVPNPIQRYRDAMDRHWADLVGEFSPAEDKDPESNLSHAAHFLCNAMFLAWFALNRADLLNDYRNNLEGSR
jgi:hypothetical protein